MRCRNLGCALKSRGADVLFICRKHNCKLLTTLREEFTVLVLDELPMKKTKGLSGKELYAEWLGCSQDRDSKDCIEALSAYNS